MGSRCILAAAMIAASLAGGAAAQTVELSWLDRYDGLADGIDGSDSGYSVAIDSQGNIVVGGYSAEPQGGTYLAIQYAPDGTRNWVATSTPPGGGIGRRMALDDQDNVIVVGVAGDFGGQFGVVKYSSTGQTLWSKTFDPGPAFNFPPGGIVTDASGNIYTFGNYGPTSTLPGDIVILKYAADGTPLWDLVYPNAQATEIAVAEDGVYLSGAERVSFRDNDMLVLKVTAAGVVDWSRTFGRSGEFVADAAYDLALDSSGNIVVAGSYNGIFSDPQTSFDIAVVRIAPDGTLLLETTYDGGLDLYEEGSNLVLDADDNAIVSGLQQDTTDLGGSNDVIILKFDPMGNVLWEQTYSGLPELTDRPFDMTIDHAGGIYVVGETWSTGPVRYYFTIKYDANGVKQWEQLYGGAPYGDSYAQAVAVSPDLKVAVTGYSAGMGPFKEDDVTTVCYTQTTTTDAGTAPSSRLQMSMFPNPFNPRTTVHVEADETGPVVLDVLDARGRRVRRLVNQALEAGSHDVQWNGLSDRGAPASSGTYYFRLVTPSGQRSVKGSLIK